MPSQPCQPAGVPHSKPNAPGKPFTKSRRLAQDERRPLHTSSTLDLNDPFLELARELDQPTPHGLNTTHRNCTKDEPDPFADSSNPRRCLRRGSKSSTRSLHPPPLLSTDGNASRRKDAGPQFPRTYFLYGALTDPKALVRALRVCSETFLNTKPARISGFKHIKRNGLSTIIPFHAVLPDGRMPGGRVDGTAYVEGAMFTVSTMMQQMRLEAHYGPLYRTVDVAIEVLQQGVRRGRVVQGKMFVDGDVFERYEEEDSRTMCPMKVKGGKKVKWRGVTDAGDDGSDFVPRQPLARRTNGSVPVHGYTNAPAYASRKNTAFCSSENAAPWAGIATSSAKTESRYLNRKAEREAEREASGNRSRSRLVKPQAAKEGVSQRSPSLHLPGVKQRPVGYPGAPIQDTEAMLLHRMNEQASRPELSELELQELKQSVRQLAELQKRDGLKTESKKGGDEKRMNRILPSIPGYQAQRAASAVKLETAPHIRKHEGPRRVNRPLPPVLEEVLPVLEDSVRGKKRVWESKFSDEMIWREKLRLCKEMEERQDEGYGSDSG